MVRPFSHEMGLPMENKEQNASVFPETLKLNKEFRRAYHQGKSVAAPYFICYRVKNRRQGVRYGITTSKKIGNAVCRSRARRLIRAAVRETVSRFDQNFDYVFVARERILTAKSYQVAAAMKGSLKALRENRPPKRRDGGE